MGRSLLASVTLHALAAVVAVLLGWTGVGRRSSMPPMVQVSLVSAAELGAVRTRPEPAPRAAVEEDPEETPAVEKVPDPERPAAERTSPSTEPTPRPGPDAGRQTGLDLPLTLEGRPFRFPWYLEELVRKVRRTWHPTSSTLSTTVYFRIAKDGHLYDAEVQRSSGNFLFDQAALRAIAAANPLPPLPREYDGDWLGVYLDFDMQARLAQ